MDFENLISEKIFEIYSGLSDPSHDFSHFKRVVQTAKKLCAQEHAKLEVVMPAAWLHDFVSIAKDDPLRNHASRLSAEAAINFLKEIHYPEIYFKEISHAIEAHSFSAKIKAETIEAQIVQDADRLDAIGAIGIARCFTTGSLLKSSFYSEQDPFCETRPPNDFKFIVDHFFVKLFNIGDSLNTKPGRAEGAKRTQIMKKYLSDFKGEIT